jgi:hypothetical protein
VIALSIYLLGAALLVSNTCSGTVDSLYAEAVSRLSPDVRKQSIKAIKKVLRADSKFAPADHELVKLCLTMGAHERK